MIEESLSVPSSRDAGLVVRVIDVGFNNPFHLMKRFFVEPDARGAVDPLDDQRYLAEPLFGPRDETLGECGGVEIGAGFELLGGGGEGRIPHFGVKAVQPFVLEKMENPLAPLAAKTVFAVMDHHVVAKLQVTVVAFDFRHVRISPLPDFHDRIVRSRPCITM